MENGGRYIVIGSNAWGRGKTTAEAHRNWKKNVPTYYLGKGKPAPRYKVFEVDREEDFITVDVMGYIVTNSGAEVREVIHRAGDKVVKGSYQSN